MTVELRHLRALSAVGDTASFTRAAERLGVSQAAVSRAVAELERELGRPLAHRTTRRVELTEAGEAFLADARRILVDLDAAVGRQRGDTVSLRIGYAWAALGEHTTPVIRAWNRDHPEQPLRLLRRNGRDAGLHEGAVDVAVVRIELDAAAYETEVVGSERRVAAVAADDPLSTARSVVLVDLVDRSIATDRVSGTTSAALWTHAGLPVPTLLQTGDVDEWLDVIAAGEAVGVTSSATALQYPRPGIVFVPLRDAPEIAVRLAWLRGRRHPSTGRLARRISAEYARG